MNEPLITISKEIMSGTPVFYGTRVPVKTLLDYLTTDETLDEFLDDFPTVSREQATALLETALQSLIEQQYENIAG
ncbi:MAG: DUF433 domain-containing protein [Chloroflexota bacterium]|nr:DUF433 domain-containing protein [Chloroflexota bacterium]